MTVDHKMHGSVTRSAVSPQHINLWNNNVLLTLSIWGVETNNTQRNKNEVFVSNNEVVMREMYNGRAVNENDIENVRLVTVVPKHDG